MLSCDLIFYNQGLRGTEIDKQKRGKTAACITTVLEPAVLLCG